MNRLLLIPQLLVLLVLSACSVFTQPGVGGPGVTGPSDVEVERTLYITQRALPDAELNDIFLTFRATNLEGEEVKVGFEPTDPAHLNVDDLRCFAVDNSNLASCELGSLSPGEVADPVAVTLSPGVRLSCAASGFVGGTVQGYRPFPCISASSPPL